MLRIRRVDISNEFIRAAVDTMIAECFKAGDFKGDQLPKALTGYWWVAFDGSAPVAFACLRPSVRWEQTGYLSIAGVLPAWRGKGLQRRLIHKRVQHARALGWHTVITETINDNAPSMRSLLGCGFKPYLPQTKWGSPYAVYFKRSTEPRLSA
jgi:GNAT superfamily N-acetyltransferase